MKTGDPAASNSQRKWDTSSAIYFAADRVTQTMPVALADDWTIEAWFRHTVWNDNQGFFTFSGGWGLGAFGNTLKWWDNGQPEKSIIGTTEISNLTNTWWHFAICRTGGNSYKVFINGTQKTSFTITGGISNVIEIGRHNYPKNYTGYVQDFRVTNGLARYTANFTPPTAEFKG